MEQCGRHNMWNFIVGIIVGALGTIFCGYVVIVMIEAMGRLGDDADL